MEQAVEKSREIGFPLVVRPSYVLGGRAMEIVYDEQDLRCHFNEAVSVSNESPVLLDSFLDDAIEVDVDAICDGERVVIAGNMEHIEQAGVHSGDSACSLPAYTLSQEIQDVMREQVEKLAFELGVRGLMNTQFAVKNNEVYLIEVNLVARTVLFVSKATGAAVAKIAARVMAGQSPESQGFTKEIIPPYYSVKEVVLPFNKFLVLTASLAQKCALLVKLWVLVQRLLKHTLKLNWVVATSTQKAAVHFFLFVKATKSALLT